MDAATWDWIEQALALTPCGMYGSTEVGVIIVNYPGFEGYQVRRGALGRAAPGWEVAVVDAATRQPVPSGQPGEIAVRRKGEWFLVKDRGWMDAEGYIHHGGRSDDVIISAGWTLSALEIEQALLAHPEVREAAVIGVPDERRGQVPQAWIVARRHDDALASELQEHVRAGSAATSSRGTSASSTRCPARPPARSTATRFAPVARRPRELSHDHRRRARLAASPHGPSRATARSPTSRSPRRDAIRHWAHGIGDRNPYWATARVAPPTILFAMDRIVSGYVGGLPGIHAMYGGTDFRWRRPIREGDQVVGTQRPARPGGQGLGLRAPLDQADLPDDLRHR